MIPLSQFDQPRDGTRWRGKRIGVRSPAIHPYPGELYCGRGPDRVAGYRWFEYEGKAVCLLERELDLVGESGAVLGPCEVNPLIQARELSIADAGEP